MTNTKRIGSQMARVAAIVSAEPGIVMHTVAKALHPACRTGKNNAFGYNPIHRAIKAGLVRKVPHPTRRGASVLYPASSPPGPGLRPSSL